MHRAVASLRARFVTPFRVLGLLGISLCLVFAPIEDVQANEKSNQVSSAKGQRKASKKPPQVPNRTRPESSPWLRAKWTRAPRWDIWQVCTVRMTRWT